MAGVIYPPELEYGFCIFHIFGPMYVMIFRQKKMGRNAHSVPMYSNRPDDCYYARIF